MAPYAQFNVGLARDFAMPDIFSPQYGPRRGFFLGIKKKICANPNSDACRIPSEGGRRDYAGRFGLPTAPALDRYNWSGFYLGLNAGGALGTITQTASGGGGSASVKEPGFIGGAQFGANYQTGPVVWGFEADYDASTQNQSLPAGALTGSAGKMPWLATLRGRVGWAFDRTLVYGTAGGAAGELRSIAAIPAGTTMTTVTYGTWTAGAGVEYGITDNLSARVEYLYLDKNNITTGVIGSPVSTITSHLQNNLVRAGMNYRFPIAK